MANAEKYECSLDKASLKKAAEELNENPKERDGAVETLRQWVEANSYWLKSPTDSVFLLNFLRTSKFVQLAARKRLVKYWETRTQHSDWFADLDTHHPYIAESLRTGSTFVLPKRDKGGRTIFVNRPGAIDPSQTNMRDLMRATIALINWIMTDENVQVNGTVSLVDLTDMGLKHQSFYGMDNVKKSMDVWLRGFAARFKEVHYYNLSPVFDAIFTIVKPMMPEKLRQRIRFHGKNLSDVYKCIDKCYLPQDYLPDDCDGKSIGTIKEIIEKQIERLREPAAREYILRLSSSGYGVDEAKKPSDAELFAESFRKLNIE